MPAIDVDSQAKSRRADLGCAWALKRSFVEYVANMPDGRMSLEGDAALTSTREFYFPYLSSAGTPGGNLVVRFLGGVAFTAHHGLMSVAVRSPVVRIEGQHGTLSVASSTGEFVLARLDGIQRHDDGDVAMFTWVDVALQETGRDLFGDTYAVGEQLAPLTIRVPQPAHTATGE